MGARRRVALGAALGLLSGALAFGVQQSGWFSRWELPFTDFLFRTHPRSDPTREVVVVGIMRECLDEPGLGGTPWPRRHLAYAISQLKQMGASAIALDIFFPQASRRSPDGRDDDAELALAIRDAGNVVLPVFDERAGEASAIAQGNATEVQHSLPELEAGALALGHINVVPDRDGVTRRCRLHVGPVDGRFTQLGVLSALLHRNGLVSSELERLATRPDSAGILRVPWRSKAAWVPGKTLFAFSDLYGGRVRPEQVAGKLVLLGWMASGMQNADVVNGPYGPQYGLLLQADMAAGVLEGRRIHLWAPVPYLLSLLLVGALMGGLFSTLRWQVMLIASGATLVGAMVGAVVLFRACDLLTSLSPAILLVGLQLCVGLGYGLARKGAEARRWERTIDVLKAAELSNGGLLKPSAGDLVTSELGIAGALADALQVPETTPGNVLRVATQVLGAEHGFLRFEDRDGTLRWVSTADDEMSEDERLPDLAVALSVILEREDHSFVLPRIESHPALRRFAGLAHSVLALRLALGERSLATLVLIDKRPTPVSPTRRFTPDDMQLALALAPQASLLLDHARLHRGLYAALRDAVATLSSAMGARDEYTSGHSARVARYAVFLADRMGLPQWCLEAVELGALLHDIGKIAMDEVVLRGARTLTAADRLLVHQHPVTGASIFSHMDELAALLPAIRHHHERYDGTGYPDGLAGDRIPLLARVVGIADSFDAMTFRRPYRERALTFEEACEELRTNAGLQFDPELVDVFVEHATSDLVFETRRGGRRQTVGIRTGDTGELLLREAQTVPIRVDSDDLRRTAL